MNKNANKYTVVMESHEFGVEEFPRDTKRECRETIANIKRTAKRLHDGIERTFNITLNK